MKIFRKKYDSFEWIDIEILEDEDVTELANEFDLDAHLLEDAITEGHLPKIEIVSNYTFLILRAYTAVDDSNGNTVEELSNKIAFFLNSQRLVTLHRSTIAFLDAVQGQFLDSESLLLHVTKLLLDSYKTPLEKQNTFIDQLEKEIFLKDFSNISIESLYFQKSKARVSKKIILLNHVVLNQLIVKKIYASELQDLKETIDEYASEYEEIIEESMTMLNSYLSINAQKTNDVMKVLTIFSAFFLPLTFIAGVYGMNFKNMPELEWDNGYFLSIGAMVAISVVIYVIFKKRGIL
jgi:magnesium transporter